MPRKYTRKTTGPSYTQEDLNRAVNDVLNKNHTYKDAEAIYGVPKSVIFHRIKGRQVPENKMGGGRPTVLSEQAEKLLVNCIKAKARMGYPCDKEDIQLFVGEYVKLNPNLKTPFKDGIPGDDWYYGFMKRHDSLKFKKPELLQKARLDARDPAVIYEFYQELETLILEAGLNDKPEFVFNTDESGFATDPKRLKAIGEKGKPLVRVSGGSGRESITVLATIAADGSYMPPLVVFKGVGVQARWTSPDAYPGTFYTTSSNGWMEEPQFFQWFSTAFVPHIKALRLKLNLPKQSALLLFDGHGSHISFRIISTAMDNNIHLVKFPSHLTDKIQPLDKCVFGPIKTNWEKKLISFAKKQIERKDSGHLPKSKFVELLGAVWRESMKPEIIIKGFSSTGVFPVNSEKFPESEFNPISLEKYRNKMQKAAVQQPQSLVITEEDATELQDKNSEIIHTSPQPSNSIQPAQQPSIFIQTTTSTSTETSTQPSTSIQTSPQPSTCKQSATPTKFIPTPSKIITIFSNAMQTQSDKYVSQDAVNKVKRKIIPRLKPVRYGEILTTKEVLQKQKEAEEAKQKKAEKSKRKTSKKNKQNVMTGKRSPTPEITDIPVYQDSSDEDMEALNQSIISQTIPEIEYRKPEFEILKIGSFLVVDFVGGNRKSVHYKYVCSIDNIDYETKDITVLGYRKHNTYSTEFVIKENDISNISFEMIQAILPEPTVREKDRVIVYVFPGSVSVFEKL